MGSPKMKLPLQLTVIAGLCYSAIAQQFCDPATKNCCQQLLKCNGICSVKHPEPDNVAAWYSHSFCDERRGCRCWTKGQCCELENKKCVDNGTCTLGIPPKDANFVAAFSCDESAPVVSVNKLTASAGKENHVYQPKTVKIQMHCASITSQHYL